MNPTTGTFISMDTYQGSIFEPATLHKYLYANANPVMYNDPSGNMFASIAISSAVNSIQEKMHTLNEMAIYKRLMAKLRIINTALTIYDTGRQVIMILNDPEIPNSQIAEAIARGIVTALFINRMCEIKALEPYVKLFVIGYGMYGQGKAIEEAAENGQWDLVIVRSLQLFIQAMSLPQTCFTGDTLVATEDGQVRIDEIEVGDKVWAYDIYTGETELKEVLTVFIHDQTEILHLHTTVGDIDTTTNHPFYVLDKGWVAAGDLNEGDEVYLIDGTTAFVTGAEIEKLDEPIKVYNLEVADIHTYFVGDTSILVHNQYDPNRPVPDPTDNHSTQTGRVGSLPAKNGPSNGSIDLFDESGNLLQRRLYDESGNAILDIDFMHGNGDGTHDFPHFHDWDWTQKPPRLKWRL